MSAIDKFRNIAFCDDRRFDCIGPHYVPPLPGRDGLYYYPLSSYPKTKTIATWHQDALRETSLTVTARLTTDPTYVTNLVIVTRINGIVMISMNVKTLHLCCFPNPRNDTGPPEINLTGLPEINLTGPPEINSLDRRKLTELRHH